MFVADVVLLDSVLLRYTAISKQLPIDFILPTAQQEALDLAVSMGGYEIMDRSLRKIDSKLASARERCDLETIRQLVANHPGTPLHG